MGRLVAVKAGHQQMTIDDYLALDRDEAPPEATATVEKGASRALAGADPDVIMAELEASGDVSRVKKGTEPHLDGDCPYMQQCESRRRRLPTYRLGQPCHWVAWRDWRRCPIYQRNGGNGR